jgi:hypothetical protein
MKKLDQGDCFMFKSIRLLLIKVSSLMPRIVKTQAQSSLILPLNTPFLSKQIYIRHSYFLSPAPLVNINVVSKKSIPCYLTLEVFWVRS